MNGAFVGLFDPNGRLERQVALPDDVQPADADFPYSDPAYRKAIELSYAQSLDNGDFVLAGVRSGGPIHIISPQGFKVSTAFRPALQPGATFSGLKMDGTTAAVMSVSKMPGTLLNQISGVDLSLWDTKTMKEVGEFYHPAAGLGSGFGCYRSGVFTFLYSGPDSQLEVVRAAA